MPDETVNFRELLLLNSDSVQRPRALPQGHYIATVLSSEVDRSAFGKQNAYCRFNMRVMEPVDVDPKLVEAFKNDGYSFADYELRKDYYITPKALYRLSDMLDAVLGKDSRSIDERIPDVTNARVLINVSPRLDKDGKDTGFNNVDDIVAYNT